MHLVLRLSTEGSTGHELSSQPGQSSMLHEIKQGQYSNTKSPVSHAMKRSGPNFPHRNIQATSSIY